MQELPIPPDPNFVVDWQISAGSGDFIDLSTAEGNLIDLSTAEPEVVLSEDATVDSYIRSS